MYTVMARNVSEALFLGKQLIESSGIEIESRAGKTLELPRPCGTTYTHPRERVLFYPQRDANPFFHCLESFWMLAGRNDVKWLVQFNKRMSEYSTDGNIFWGAYGHRWRRWFDEDQLDTVIYRLKNFPNDRRTVLGIWDVICDLTKVNDQKDIPCNTHVYFKVRDNKLNMTVCCRSNDMIWGAYGANAVHFSFLQEYIAARVGVEVGMYTQVSDSFHAYVEVLEKLGPLQADYDPYLTLGKGGKHFIPKRLVDDPTTFDQELRIFMEDEEVNYPYKNTYFNEVLEPMRKGHFWWRMGDKLRGLKIAETITADDWRKACVEWMERRLK